jgi:hypothetical protein
MLIVNPPGGIAMSDADPSRRRIVRAGFIAALAAPFARHIALAQKPQGGEKLDENSQQAKALHYRDDATKTDDPKRKSDQFCRNCQFFQGDASAASAPCAVFQNKLVAAGGWCSSWVAKVAAK